MNGIHDMGGMQDMGPVRIEPNEPVFHTEWERRAFALFWAAAPDDFRYQIELIPPAEYLRMSYYERLFTALGPLLTDAGMLTPAELESGKAVGPPDPKWHVLSVADVASWIAPESPVSAKPTATARFHVGQRVRARNINPVGHTRLPRYTRGKIGTIARKSDVEPLEDRMPQGLGEKLQQVYSVRFSARELWGEKVHERDTVYVDMWEGYLEPA
jgi:nitrile hydratase